MIKELPRHQIFPSTKKPLPDLAVESIKHVALGGTIDSRWDAATDSISPLENSTLPTFLEEFVRIRRGVNFVQVCMKDSRQLESPDREKMIAEVVEEMQQAALVTSGTYAAADLANQLKRSEQFAAVRKLKKAIFTGALTPLKGFTQSDGGFNLGMSHAAFQSLKAGEVALCMNGRVVMAGEVAKDTNSTIFTPTHPRYNKWDRFNELHLITAGGTIDFVANGFDGFDALKRSSVADYLRGLNLHQRIVALSNLGLKDSRELTRADVEKLVEQVKAVHGKKVLVTIGLYGMENLYERLAEEKALLNTKTIVITGSRFPLRSFELSDAPYQLGFAIGSLATLKNGVYISLSGDILDPKIDKVMDLFRDDEISRIQTQVV